MMDGMTRRKIAITLPEDQVVAARRAVAEGRSPSVSAYIAEALARRDADDELGATLDTGALIALEAGSRRMAVLVEEALASGATLAIPAGVLAQAWRGGARQARIARLLRASISSVIPLDERAALRIGARCAITG